MSKLTVFTPTYNRAHCLHKLYHSLRDQTCKKFIWLVIDDGSIDNTAELVQEWISEGSVFIRYFYKCNGGMHTAHNLAYSLIDTEINTCIDSDDSMPINAVENILENWKKFKDDKSIAGMVGLDENVNGELIGTSFPENINRSTLGRLYNKYGVTGDKKLVYRTDITKAYPSYPEYYCERLVPLGRLYVLIDRDYEIACVNSVWVTVDYQIGGSSDTIIKQYLQSPKGFKDARITSIKYGEGVFYRLRNVIHLGVSNLILRKVVSKDSPTPLLSWLFSPISFLTFLYINWKIK